MAERTRVASGVLLLLTIACAPPSDEVAAGGAPDLPNILWILAEDMGPELGVYGTPETRTPNLDSLAARGMRFTRAFTTSPVCSTSRSAFHTGMYQMAIGAHNHRSHRDGYVAGQSR